MNWFCWIFQIIFHILNQSSHKFSNQIQRISKRIQHLKNLIPHYSWSQIKLNEFQINFHRSFRIFFALSNQANRKFLNQIERISNEFQFDSIPSLEFEQIISALCEFPTKVLLPYVCTRGALERSAQTSKMIPSRISHTLASFARRHFHLPMKKCRYTKNWSS